MDLEDMKLSEKSQTEKDKWLYDLTYMQNLKKPNTGSKTRMMVTKGQGGEWKQVVLVEGCVQRVCKFNHSVMSDSLQPTRLLCPWNFSGKNIGVAWHFLLLGVFLTHGQRSLVGYIPWGSQRVRCDWTWKRSKSAMYKPIHKFLVFMFSLLNKFRFSL